jgi:hypothetical protein
MASKIQKTELRFNSKKQKLAMKKIAIMNNRSVNSEINIAIDNHISSYETFPVKSKESGV